MNILYFAALRDLAECAAEDVTPPPEVTTVAALICWLKERGGGPAAALADLSIVRVAVDQDYAGPEHPVAPDSEVAFFPPVTGGSAGGRGR